MTDRIIRAAFLLFVIVTYAAVYAAGWIVSKFGFRK